MSVEGNKALTIYFIEEVNKGEAATMEAMDELFSPDFIFHSATGEDMGLEGLKKHLSESFSAFPDLHFTLDDMVAEGNKVASRFTMSGTHKGGFSGIPPTNRKFEVWAINIIRIVNGKCVEEWERYDTLGMMQQLGLR